MNLKGKAVAVVGLGKSGEASARFLLRQKAKVRVTDGFDKKEVLDRAAALSKKGASVETGGHTEAFLDGVTLVVTSPGVPKSSLPLAWAKKKGVPVISEIELATHFCPGKIIAVTGSNGKTTTCHLIHRMLKAARKKTVLCGNIGHSFLDALPKIKKDTIVVLELSSFQLEDSPSLKPDVALVLNISPNHLDRHGDLSAYTRAKENIFRNQTSGQVVVLNHRDPIVRAMAKRAKSRVVFFADKAPSFDPTKMKLKGTHNLENAMAAAAAVKRFGIPDKAVQKTLERFETLHHRIEPVGTLNGVRFVNDSKSTTVDSTRAAIEAMDGAVVLVAGGRDKGVTFSEIEGLLERRVKMAVLYGEARHKIASSWATFKRFKLEADFAEAVRTAFQEAREGETLLLSPMCTSFDQFSSYGERGQAFRRVFEELKAKWTR